MNSILVPTAGGPHAEIARAIAHATGARVEVIYVTTPDDTGGETAQSILDRTAETLEGVETTTELVEGDDVADVIVERSGDHDLTIIGASRESLLEQLVFGAIPEAVGRRAEGTVIMAKRDLGITSRVTRWIRNQRS